MRDRPSVVVACLSQTVGVMHSVACAYDARSAGVTAPAPLLVPTETSEQREHASDPAIAQPLRQSSHRADRRQSGERRRARRAGIRLGVTWTDPFAVARTFP